jgi:hypothetical protein
MHALSRQTVAFTLILLFPLLTVTSGVEAEPPLSRLAVIALAPLDGQAVVKLPSGTMHLVRQGERIPGTNAKVVQVLPDRLMVSHADPTAGETLAWIYQAPAQGGFSRVMFLRHPTPHPEREQVSTP